MAAHGFALEEFTDQYVQYQAAKYLATVSLVLLVYDWILGIDREIEFIWGQSWSWGRVIYHANRIWSLTLLGTALTVILFLPEPSVAIFANRNVLVFDTLFADSCKRVGYMYSYGAICQYGIISAMLLLRCWALFENRLVVWVLCGGFVGTTIAGVLVANFIISRAQYRVNPLPSIFTGCYIVVPDYLWMTYVAPIIYETTLFILTLWRIRTLARVVGASPLLETLRTNGIAYFGALVALVVIGWTGTRIHNLKIATNGSGLFTAISSVVCSRMIFSLYEINGAEILGSYADSHTPSNPSNDIIPRFAIPLQSFTTAS